jgi:hypothetical protein
LSDPGYVAVHRSIWDHDVFEPAPFSEREAWLWLVSSAAWKPTKVRVGYKMLSLERGDLSFSERFLAEKWRWSKSKVHRFLALLEGEQMIVRKSDHGLNQITICNYDKYQAPWTTTRTENGPETDQKRTKEEEPNNSITQEVSKKETREDALSIEFDGFWKIWPNKVAKSAAEKAYRSARKRGASPDVINEGVWAYIRNKPPDRPWLNPSTFLNQSRWEDRPAKVEANGYRTANSRTTGHDAILAAALGEARKIIGDRELARSADAAEFPGGGGSFGRATGRSRIQEGTASPSHDGRESFGGPVLEGEIVASDEADAWLPGGWRVFGGSG